MPIAIMLIVIMMWSCAEKVPKLPGSARALHT